MRFDFFVEAFDSCDELLDHPDLLTVDNSPWLFTLPKEPLELVRDPPSGRSTRFVFGYGKCLEKGTEDENDCEYLTESPGRLPSDDEIAVFNNGELRVYCDDDVHCGLDEPRYPVETAKSVRLESQRISYVNDHHGRRRKQQDVDEWECDEEIAHDRYDAEFSIRYLKSTEKDVGQCLMQTQCRIKGFLGCWTPEVTRLPPDVYAKGAHEGHVEGDKGHCRDLSDARRQ